MEISSIKLTSSKTKPAYNKKYTEDQRVIELKLSPMELERYYTTIIQMVEGNNIILVRDEGGKLHVYHKIDTTVSTEWVYKTFSDKFAPLKLTKEFFGGEVSKNKPIIVETLAKTKNPKGAYYYSANPKDVEVMIAFAIQLVAGNKTVSFLDMEEIYSKYKKGINVDPIFEKSQKADVVFVTNLRDFESSGIFNECLIPLLKARIIEDLPTIFFSDFKIIELSRRMERKFKYQDFGWKQFINIIQQAANGSELSF